MSKTAALSTVCLLIFSAFLGCKNPLHPSEPEIGVPSQPLPPSGSVVADSTPLLAWENVPNATGYQIEVSTLADFSNTPVASADALTEPQYQVAVPLSNNSTYYWRVKAQDANGWKGEWSATWLYTVDLASVTLLSPASATVLTDTSPTLQWLANEHAASYHVRVDNDSAFVSPLLDQVGISATAFTFTGVEPQVLAKGQTYYWQVRPIDGEGVEGDWSSVWSLTVQLPAPVGPSPANRAALPDTTPLLNWGDVAGASSYQLQLSGESAFLTPLLDIGGLTQSQYPISTVLTDHTTYHWRVRMLNEDGVEGDWSTAWSFTVSLPSPSLLSPNNSGISIGKKPLLDWADVPGAASYHIQVNTGSGFGEPMLADDASLASSQYLMSTALAPDVTYYWRVRIGNEDGVAGDWSAPWSFTVKTISAVAGGGAHTIALRNDSTLWAWGGSGGGQLGDGTTTTRGTPVPVSGLTGVMTCTTGAGWNYARTSDGSVYYWGGNYWGQLGDGTRQDRLTPTLFGSLNDTIEIKGGYAHTVALRSDGTVWTWGFNRNGQLGDGTTSDRYTPVQVSGLSAVVAVEAGAEHTVALQADGTVWTWGATGVSQLPDGTPITMLNWRSLMQYTALGAVTDIEAGASYTVVLKADGTVWAWGNNGSGRLGDGTTENRNTPVQVVGLSEVTAISCGASEFTVALKSDGTVWAWGENNNGMLGDGTTTDRYTPVQVSGLSGVVAIEAGSGHTLAIKADGTVWAWGMNHGRQLGDGTWIDRHTPVQVKW